MTGLQGRERSLTIFSAVWIQSTNVTDRWTPGDAKTALTHSVTRKKTNGGRGSAPDPAVGAYSAPQTKRGLAAVSFASVEKKLWLWPMVEFNVLSHFRLGRLARRRQSAGGQWLLEGCASVLWWIRSSKMSEQTNIIGTGEFFLRTIQHLEEVSTLN